MIYYSHVNEDNRAEIAVMDRDAYKVLAAVCGSGERIISLLNHPGLSRIEVIDKNVEALYLLQLKLAALAQLDVQEYLSFIGHPESSGEAEIMYANIRTHLDPECRKFWDDRIHLVKKGILHAGHFENFLSRIRPLFRVLLGRDFYALFRDPGHKLKRPTKLTWALIRKAFAMRTSYRAFGMQDIAFIAEDTSLEVIPDALQESIENGTVSTCFMAHLVFFGSLDRLPPEHMPPSLDAAHLSRARESLRKGRLQIRYHPSDFMEAVRSLPNDPDAKTYYATSDLLSFEPAAYIHDLLDALSARHNQGFSVVSRSFLRHRFDQGNMDNARQKGFSCADISHLDRTNMYQVIQIENDTA